MQLYVTRERLKPYAPAIVCTTIAVVARLLMNPVVGTRLPYQFFFLAVVVSAYLGGVGPGIASTLIGGIAALYLFVPPYRTVFPIQGADHQLGFAVYLFVSTILITVVELQHRANRRAQEETAARRRAEEDERNERHRFEITLASIGDGVIATDSEGRITYLNPIAAELTGWRETEALGQPIENVFVLKREGTGATIEGPTVTAIRDKRSVALANHTILIKKSGDEIPIDDTAAPILDAAGSAIGSVLVFHDITEARRREQDSRQFHRLIQLSRDAIIQTSAKRRITGWNLGAQEMYGWTAEEARGNDVYELLRTDEAVRERIDKLLLEEGHWDGELIQVAKNGNEVRCESRQVLLRDEDGKVECLLKINRDITERTRMEERFLQTAKLESLGVLAGGIAHDFNNLLAGVLANADLLLQDVGEGSTTWSYAQSICKAAERAAELAQQMLAYSGRGTFVIEPVNLAQFVRQTAVLIQASIPKSVTLEFQLAEDLPLIDADISQLQQLVMNVVINGAEAIDPAGGRVTIAAKSQTVDELYCRTLALGESLKPGQYAALEITDTGCGMDAETLSRIFDPFFTTKFVGRGLGLAAVLGIVRAHKGAIKIYSEPGRGTTFYLLLPASTAEAVRDTNPRTCPVTVQESKMILIIDDEEIVRSAATSALRRLGYGVLTASDGGQAVQVFRSLHTAISLVILDLTMPGISGEETLQQLRSINPDTPIILSSGFSGVEASRRFGDSAVAGFLQKPYRLETLARHVSGAITPVGNGAQPDD